MVYILKVIEELNFLGKDFYYGFNDFELQNYFLNDFILKFLKLEITFVSLITAFQVNRYTIIVQYFSCNIYLN